MLSPIELTQSSANIALANTNFPFLDVEFCIFGPEIPAEFCILDHKNQSSFAFLDQKNQLSFAFWSRKLRWLLYLQSVYVSLIWIIVDTCCDTEELAFSKFKPI